MFGFKKHFGRSVERVMSEDQYEEYLTLRKEMKMSNEDWELGKKSPRDLAIKWLCRAVSVSSYNWENQELLMNAIDRLIALDNANNTQQKRCSGDCERCD